MMEFITTLLFTFWFFGPAGVANMAAFLSSKIPVIGNYNYPVDFYVKIGGKRILGSHKTIRGFVFAIIASTILVLIEMWLYSNVSWIRDIVRIDYTTINPYLLGFLLGFGALLGDAVKSFFKRRINIKPGGNWFPFDQIDYILGGVLFSAFYLPLTIFEYVVLFFLWFLIHPMISFVGYLFKLRKQPI